MYTMSARISGYVLLVDSADHREQSCGHCVGIGVRVRTTIFQIAGAIRRKVGMHSGSVSVPLGWLGIEGHGHSVILTDPLQQPTHQPDVIRSSQSIDRTDLELGLTGHDFPVCASEGESGIDRRLHELLIDLASEDFAESHRAVGWTLRTWITTRWEAVRTTIWTEECVLLFKAKQRIGLGRTCIQYPTQFCTSIGSVQRARTSGSS